MARPRKYQTFEDNIVDVVKGVQYLGGEHLKELSTEETYNEAFRVAYRSFSERYESMTVQIWSESEEFNPLFALNALKSTLFEALADEIVKYSDRRAMHYIKHETIKISINPDFVEVCKGNQKGYRVVAENVDQWLTYVLFFLGYVDIQSDMEGFEGQQCEKETDSEITYSRPE